MSESTDPLAADRGFFEALIGADVDGLGALLVDDFILIDVMSGSVVDKPSFLHVIGSGDLVFEAIKPSETMLRTYGDAAVVTGRTKMRGTFGGAGFEAASRYTHVFARIDGVWRMVSAQGTKITE